MSAGLDQLLPTASVGACLAGVIAYLLASNRADRVDYREAVDRAERRADDEGARALQVQYTLDEVRAERRAAEDKADEMRREIHDLRTEVRRLRQRVEDVQRRVEGVTE